MRKRIVPVLMGIFMAVNVCALAACGGETAATSPDETAQSSSKEIRRVTDTYASEMHAATLDAIDRSLTEQPFADPEERVVILKLTRESMLDAYLASGSQSEFAGFATTFEALSYKRLAESEQRETLSALDALGVDYELRHTYASILNGLSIKVKREDLPKLSTLASVEQVIYSERYSAPEAAAVENEVKIYGTGIYDSSDVAYQGDGMLVAILDTGLDYTHEAFRTMPEEDTVALTREQVEEKMEEFTFYGSDSRLTVDNIYLNAKVPFAYDYADSDTNVFPMTVSHGTHVAGIIAGQADSYVNKDGEVEVDAAGNPVPFRGVAPNAQLAIFKVFSDNGETGAETDDLLAALSDATTLGVDVINMSLGADMGFSRDSDETAANDIYDAIREAGISLICAAANAYSAAYSGTYGQTNLATNPDSGTVGSPSTYAAALSVASISGQLSPYMVTDEGAAIYFENASNAASKQYDFAKEMLDGAESKTYDYVVVPGYGTDFNYSKPIREKLAAGNCIAVVKRGGNVSFEDKQRVAAQNGAVACIIYNNVSGTIRASLGSGKKIPTCSVSMDTGEILTAGSENAIKTGKLTISRTLSAGPFMSNFSSWGPTGDLKMAPEITAHGGEITSSVVGGWSQYSGTSMACPNLAGATTLLRQSLKAENPDLSDRELTALVNRKFMSTATIIRDESGNPYFTRRQGAGLGDIYKAINTDAYLYVEGSDKTKIELGDDPARAGVYTLRFRLANTSDRTKKYTVNTYTMTDQLSSDGITVAEKSYMLDGVGKYVKVTGEGGSYEDGVVTVAAGADVALEVVLTLDAAARDYLYGTFKNGYYVEGFVELFDLSEENAVDLSIPYLAFYGNWLDAPVFDYSSYEVSQDAFDSSIEDEDKRVSAIYETVLLGRYYDDDSLLPLGQYVFELGPNPEVMSSLDKCAISGNKIGVYEFYAVYAGMFRNAKTVHATITDSVTGEVVYEETVQNVRKSGGGSGRPAFIDLAFNPKTLGLLGNTKYILDLEAAIDYENGENAANNKQQYCFYIDYEAPTVQDYEIRSSYDANDKRHLYLDVYVYDNHYTQGVRPFVVANNAMSYLGDYFYPATGSRGSTSKITIEITDDMDRIMTGGIRGNIGLITIDYAMNQEAYILPVTFTEMDEISITEDFEHRRPITEDISLKVGESFRYYVDAKLEGESVDGYDVDVSCSPRDVVEIEDGLIHALKAGTATVTLTAKNTAHAATYSFRVNVSSETGGSSDVQSIAISEYVHGGVTYKFSGSSLLLQAGEYDFNYAVTPFFAEAQQVQWTTSNERIASIDPQTGVVTAKAAGSVTIGVSCYVASRNLTLRASVTITVDDVYDVLSGYFYAYHGVGGDVVIPADMSIIYVAHYADGTAGPFYRNQTIDRVFVPEGVTTIGAAAFSGSSVREVYLPTTIEAIGEQAFYNCTNLEHVYWYTKDGMTWDADLDTYTELEEGTLALGTNFTEESTAVHSFYVGSAAFSYCSKLAAFDFTKTGALYSSAFSSCGSLKYADLTTVRYGGSYVFSNCSSLSEVVIGEYTDVGSYAFSNCGAIREVVWRAKSVPTRAFNGCTGLVSVTFTDPSMKSIGVGAFDGCSKLSQVTFAGSLEVLNQYAFSSCTSLTTFDAPSGLTAIQGWAFWGDTQLTKFRLPASGTRLTTVGTGIFTGCNNLTDITLEGNSRYLTHVVYTVGGTSYGAIADKATGKLLLVPYGYATLKQRVDLDPSTEVIGDEQFGGYDFEEKISYEVDGVETVVYENGVLTIPEGVKHIGYSAFNDTNGIHTLILPSTLETMGERAFYLCNDLESVIFKSDLKRLESFVFWGDHNLKEVQLPATLEFLGNAVFRETSLRSIVIPKNVRTINPYCFNVCPYLEEVKFEDGSRLETLNYSTFEACYSLKEIVLPEGLKTIGKNAFASCYSLEHAVIPSTVTAMGTSIFMNTPALTDVEFKEGLQIIGPEMFAWKTNAGGGAYNDALTSVKFPKSLRAIGPGAFEGCRLLTELDFSEVENLYIDQAAFYECEGLTKVTFAKRTEYIGPQAFSYCLALTQIENEENILLIAAQAFPNLPIEGELNFDSLQMLGGQAFTGNTHITAVNMPEVTTLYSQAFYNCTSLASVTMPKLEVLQAGVFFHSALTEVTLPASVEEISDVSFNGIDNLEKIGFENGGNDKFFVDEDGVLYRYLNEDKTQFEAVCFPTGSKLTEYTVLEGTKIIGIWAFALAEDLQVVTLPKSLEIVRSGAFYGVGMSYVDLSADGSTVRATRVYYIFTADNAPLLECDYSSDGDNPQYVYNQFTYYWGYVIQPNAIFPENGRGYNTWIWETYFNVLEELPEDLGETAEQPALLPRRKYAEEAREDEFAVFDCNAARKALEASLAKEPEELA